MPTKNRQGRAPGASRKPHAARRAAPPPTTLVVTMGDPAGVGPEIIVKALGRVKLRRGQSLLVAGERACFEAAAATVKRKFRLPQWLPGDRLPPGQAVFCQTSFPGRPVPRPGRTGARSGRLAAEAIRAAAALCNAGIAAGMVTAPINKTALRKAGVPHPGHTGWLAELSGTRRFAMLFLGERLRVALATIHLPLRKVPGAVTTARVLEVIGISDELLRRRLGLRRPRIAVAGLNPHAGEAGLLGTEDATRILPAVRRARARGIAATGPLPGDTVFRRALNGEFDLVVAMYHDQGLAAIKTLEGFRAVNVTAGLPWVRTSVDHGTAEDIAGRGIASEEGLVAAIEMGFRLAERR